MAKTAHHCAWIRGSVSRHDKSPGFSVHLRIMISVRLKPELEVRLKRVAKMTGKTVSGVIQEAVEEHCENALKTETLDESPHPVTLPLND